MFVYCSARCALQPETTSCRGVWRVRVRVATSAPAPISVRTATLCPLRAACADARPQAQLRVGACYSSAL